MTHLLLPQIDAWDSHSMQLSVDVPPGDPAPGQEVTGYIVRFKKGGDEGSRVLHYPKDGPFVLANLQPATVYVLQIASRNVAGLSPFSEQIVRRTDNRRTAKIAA
ncbi:Fibronectin type III, partial [Trinorchestia longiramus]